MVLAAVLAVAATLACTGPPMATARAAHVQIIDAPAGEVAAIVRNQLAASAKAQRRALVYVGATWCEPCQRLHDAAQRHEMDDVLGNVDMLVFDLDKDRERLEAAGYGSRMIPLLAVPGPDGRGSGTRMEGSVKGAGAIDEMRPRLRALLASP